MTLFTRYCLRQDQSCHWYLVPAEHAEAFDRWCALPQDQEEAWDEPSYAKRLDGYHHLTFIDPRDE